MEISKSISKIFLIIYLFSLSNCLIIKDEYTEASQEFRAAWVSPWGGDADLIKYYSKEDFITKMTYILDTFKMYNMNSIIYHVRTHNDALYPSKLNPVSPYFKGVKFDEFNPLEWMIKETHKRGMDFHAWMNPYRIKSGNQYSMKEILELYNGYENPANDSSCILNGTDTIILDPGLQKVRKFIADTILEFLGQFDVEAIHFDDYFYCDMGAGGRTEGEKTILDEPDQKTYEDYIDAHPECEYEKDNAKDKANWRRYQVNLLIILLKEQLDEYNKKNNKHVQLGISPTGIYKNGDGEVTYDKDGNAITTGSKTDGGQEHFASYLFCDTLKWINHNWIHYILPQSYWAADHPRAGYKNVMGWWNKVVKYKNVNLYSGLGLYMADLSGKTYGWQTNDHELYDQFVYVNQGEYIDGPSIYNFHTLRKLRDGESTISATQIKNGMVLWTKLVPPKELRCFTTIKLGSVQNVVRDKNKLTFDKLNNAKFYLIYKSESSITFDAKEIVDIFGSEGNTISWEDPNPGDKNYNYGIKALSYTNTLGDGVIA